MSIKESAKTGFIERATVEIIEPSAPVVLSPGWYWYRGEPVYLYGTPDMEIVWVRGYNFTTKEEWRRSDLDLSELRPCK